MPAQLSIFIGRKIELEAVQRLLVEDPSCRLLTLVGPGGIGKTRLSVEAAYGVLRSFEDGVLFVSLASLTSPDQIITAILESLSLRFYDERLAESYLLNVLREKRMLLVLDSAEHLLPGMDLAARILQSATHIKVLVTSRERLNLTGEMVFSLGPMSYPEKHDKGDLVDYSAVQLLIHYARLARPNLVLDEKALEGIVQICRLVEGMPLALVLAAGWMEVLTFPEIAEEISQSLDFLESQARDLPERQRSVRAAFEYSWKRLSAEEQAVFSCLSVFREGFTRQAAEQVAGAGLRTLRNLIDRSFISIRQNGLYGTHELLRQFGEEYLVASGRAEAVLARHSHYYLALLAGLEKEIKGLRQFEALDEIEMKMANIRSAWDWAIAHRMDDDIDQALESVYLYFACRSRYLEGAEFLSSAHQLMTPRPDEKPPRVCGRVLARYAWILALHREPDPKIDGYIQHCLELANQSGDQQEVAFNHLLLGCYHLYAKQEPEAALAYLERCYQLYLALDDKFYITIALLWIGSCHAEATGVEPMMEYSRQCYEMSQATGNMVVIPFVLRNLARGALYLGDYLAAEQYTMEAKVYQERMGLRMGLAESKMELSLIQLLRGDLEEAQTLAEEGLAIGRELSFMWAIADGQAILSLREAILGRVETSRALAEKSIVNPSSLFTNVIAHWALAITLTGVGQYEQAWQHILEAFTYASRLSYYAVQVWPLPVAAFLLARNGQDEPAVEVLSFAFHHPRNLMGWTAHWKPYQALYTSLEERLGKAKMDTAWARGESRTLEDVMLQIADTAPQVMASS